MLADPQGLQGSPGAAHDLLTMRCHSWLLHGCVSSKHDCVCSVGSALSAHAGRALFKTAPALAQVTLRARCAVWKASAHRCVLCSVPLVSVILAHWPLQAAGAIHSDFERGFICAEVMHYDELKELGTESAVKAAGKYRQEGAAHTASQPG